MSFVGTLLLPSLPSPPLRRSPCKSHKQQNSDKLLGTFRTLFYNTRHASYGHISGNTDNGKHTSIFCLQQGPKEYNGEGKESNENSRRKELMKTLFHGDKSCLCCAARRRDILSHIVAAGLIMAPPSMAENTEFSGDMESVIRWHGKRSAWQEELFADVMANGMQKYETQVSDIKQDLFRELKERSVSMEVLELGMGTGPNLSFYANPGVHITAVDPNLAMKPFAEKSAKNANLSPSQLSFLIGVGESLPLPNNSVDYVVGTLVLCSVTDVESVLREVLRVLKPGGRYFFLEHVAAHDGTILRAMQGFLDPVQQFLADGCHLTRNPLPYMETVGFDFVNGERREIPGLGLLSPHLLGFAQK